MGGDAGEQSEAAELRRAITRDRRRALAVALALLGVFVGAMPVWARYRNDVRGLVNREMDLEGRPQYVPREHVPPRRLRRIDFRRVHSELIPAWSISLARATTPARMRTADRSFELLANEIGPDPNLSALLGSSHRALREDPIARARRIDYWLWAYNHYLDERRVPWRIEASLSLTEEGRAVFRTMTYEVLADARTREGHRLRLLRRADPTNTMEGWLGHANVHGEGALVLMQRVLHFTVRHVWPGLHLALDERRPAAERPWLGYVREEVRSALDEDTYALLEETASDQQALIEVAEAIEGRAWCGSNFRVYGLPYNGLTARSRIAIEQALARSQGEIECPEITLDEAARIIGASERLETTPRLEDALERLAMVVARAVGAHELRHVADGEAPACPGCPEGLDGIALAEVSAYLSAFSTEGLGYLSLLQACATTRGSDVHGAALDAVLEVILPYGCAGPTRHDLYSFATRFSHRLFGKRFAVVVPELPDRVRLLPRARYRRPAQIATPLASGWGVALDASPKN
jgi:hypothetical protein